MLDQKQGAFTKRKKLFCYGYSCFGTLYLLRPIHKICYNIFCGLVGRGAKYRNSCNRNRIVSFVLYIYIYIYITYILLLDIIVCELVQLQAFEEKRYLHIMTIVYYIAYYVVYYAYYVVYYIAYYDD